MIKRFLFVLLLLPAWHLFAQSQFPAYYAVFFTDKASSPYSVSQPEAFLSSRALDRYERLQVAIGVEDLPVSPAYLDSVNAKGAEVYSASRWMNAALVICADTTQLEAIDGLSVVQALRYLGPYDTLVSKKVKQAEAGDEDTLVYAFQSFRDAYGSSFHQLDMLDIPHLHKQGLEGQGVQIAVLDAGFWMADKAHAFDSLYLNGRILTERDLVHKGNNIYRESTHGSLVLSVMAAHLPGTYKGAACDASYHLIRTENTSGEYPVEEFHWITGAELADSLGADIIASSLSYNTFDDSTLNYTHADLTGNVALVSQGASIAATKGLLIVNSAGNQGDKSWRKIGFPCDVDQILCVGAVDSVEQYAPFSSVGYTADFRVKPDVVAQGQRAFLVSHNDNVFRGNGTSYSSPMIAAGAALLMQANPASSPDDIREAIKASASHYQVPDTAFGFGIPNFMLADMMLKQQEIPVLTEEESFKVVPNPFQYELSVVYEATDTQQIDIGIYDLTGKMVWEYQGIQQLNGHNVIRLRDLHSFSDGVYFIRIVVDGKVYSHKIIKHQ